MKRPRSGSLTGAFGVTFVLRDRHERPERSVSHRVPATSRVRPCCRPPENVLRVFQDLVAIAIAAGIFTLGFHTRA